MMKRKLDACISAAIGCLVIFSCGKQNSAAQTPGLSPPASTPATNMSVPIAGNGYITEKPAGEKGSITDSGFVNWSETGTIASIYFRLAQTGSLHVAVRAKVPLGNSSVTVTVDGSSFTVNPSTNDYKSYYAGTVNITKPGYVKVDLQGTGRTGAYFAEVTDILIGGSATSSNVVFANDPQNFYWSRRGPSCHLGYTTPAGDIEYFYSELTVPAGEDKTGSYFMSNGFSEGYFGIQVNSDIERRVLFSVWDPASGQTTLVRKGENVTAGRFGGEGTGGQSYFVFNWKAGVTYKFLTKGKPDGAGSTVYTSWFFVPEQDTWKLIASWTRPGTHTYLTRFHGFLENFYPDQGYRGRKAHWGNQWVRLANGEWSEVTTLIFTVDATGANKQRLDYAGGVENGKFFLQMNGFFANNVQPNSIFTRTATNKHPDIDLDTLP